MPKNHAHEIEMIDEPTFAQADADLAAPAVLAQLDKTVLSVLKKSGRAVPVEDQFVDYNFPVENRERDRRVLNWAHKNRAEEALKSALEREPVATYSDEDKVAFAKTFLAGYTFPPDFGTKLSMLDECIDRVRWDAMVAGTAGNPAGEQRTGKYDDNRKASDIAERAEDCAAIKAAIMGDNPDLMCSHIGQTYLDLVLAKADEVQGIKHPVRTRTPKANKSKKIPL